VTEFLAAQLAETGCNYVVGQFAFGDLSLTETLRTVDLFTRHVMPALRGDKGATTLRVQAERASVQ
jgi:hypothetical protein